MNKVGSGYFEAMGLRIVTGRAFEPADDGESAAPVTIISESMATAIWPEDDPLGQCMLMGGDEAEDQAVPPRDFTDTAYMNSRTDGQLFYQILAGGGGESPMPAFGPGSDQAWNEEKIWGMVAFVRRFSEPAED